MSAFLTDEEISFELAKLYGLHDFAKIAQYKMPELRMANSYEEIIWGSINSGWWAPLKKGGQLFNVASIPFGTSFGLRNKGSIYPERWSAYPVDARGVRSCLETVYLRSLPHAVALALIAAQGVSDERIVERVEEEDDEH